MNNTDNTRLFSQYLDLTLQSKESKNPLKTACINTPLGAMIAIADEKALYLLEFLDTKNLETEILQVMKLAKSNFVEGSNVIINLTQRELAAYFKGELRTFTLPTECLGSAFQLKVWQALQTIPYAQTRSYSEQAILIGKPSACRAVANANGANRIAIIVPCHRVINQNGKLGGYAGGLDRKEWLLQHEQRFTK